MVGATAGSARRMAGLAASSQTAAMVMSEKRFSCGIGRREKVDEVREAFSIRNCQIWLVRHSTCVSCVVVTCVVVWWAQHIRRPPSCAPLSHPPVRTPPQRQPGDNPEPASLRASRALCPTLRLGSARDDTAYIPRPLCLVRGGGGQTGPCSPTSPIVRAPLAPAPIASCPADRRAPLQPNGSVPGCPLARPRATQVSRALARPTRLSSRGRSAPGSR